MTKREQNLRFKGLTSEEVTSSRQKHGVNVLTPPKRTPWWQLYLEKFDDPVIRILIIAAVIATITGIVDGRYIEGVGIIIAILLATTLAFLNEYRAKQEFDILNRVNDDLPIKVIREGYITTVPRKDLVVGDLVMVELGDEVPADGQLLEAVSLQIDEARLTGESKPIIKVPADNLNALKFEETTYPRNRLYRGSIAVDGHGIFQLTAVGDATELGKTARAAAEETKEETPLKRQLDRLSKLIGFVGLIVAGLTYTALLIRGIIVGELVLTEQQWYFNGILHLAIILAMLRVCLPIIIDGFELFGIKIKYPSWLNHDKIAGWTIPAGLGLGVLLIGIAIGMISGLMSPSPAIWLPGNIAREFLKYFMIAVTIIVVAVPEGLAMSVTLSLAYSMRRLMASNNLVRRMHACETIGAATVICTDKTGTLTLNMMRLHEANFPSLNGKQTGGENQENAAALVFEAIAVNSTANLERKPDEAPRSIGNPTEGALLLWLEEQGLDYVQYRNNFAINHQWTFSNERKFMATLGTSPTNGEGILHVKGAPEIILERCTHLLTNAGIQSLDADRERIKTELKHCQARGMRTLSFAFQQVENTSAHLKIEDLATNLIWLGFVSITDPLRSDVPEAIKACKEAGIEVKIITGDNPETAEEIARQVGLWEKNNIPGSHLSGQEFSKLTDDEAKAYLRPLKILSRARPMDKLRLVKLLREDNQVVAVTGDGVNDSPALNYADVGFAMGQTGTAVAKESSDIILLDDSFRSIVNAVMWGRSLYQNIQRFILFQLTINVAALAIALLGPFIGIKFPLTVMQMLWVNLIMDTFAALALATEPPHTSVMKRPPRDPKEFIVTRSMATNIFTVASIFLFFLVGLLLYIQKDSRVTEYELSAFFTIFVMLQFWNLFNARRLGLKQSVFTKFWQNKWFITIALAILGGQILLVQVGGTVFRTVPLSVRDLALITLGTSLVLWVGEIRRFIGRLRTNEVE